MARVRATAAVAAVVALLAACVVSEAESVVDLRRHPSPEVVLAPPEHRGTYRRVMNPAPGTAIVAADGTKVPTRVLPDSSTTANPTIVVTDFGADPTGKADSSSAFAAAVTEALSRGALNHSLADGMKDLGGVIVDLAGGDYLLSKPVVWPPMYGNFRMQGGTLRAAPSFPAHRYLVEVGTDDKTVCPFNQKSCNENVGFVDMMFDAQHVAAGCLQINMTMGGVVGPQMFFLGFTDKGLDVNSGHEIMLSNAWFGEFLYSYPGVPSVYNTTAIELDGNDHFVTDTIVFKTHVGLRTTGAANVIVGLHTWNSATAQGGYGIIVMASQTRLSYCYLDYNALVLVDAQDVTAINTFFLGGGNLVLQVTKPNVTIHGVNVVDSVYSIGNGPANDTVVVDTRYGSVGQVTDTVIDASPVLGPMHKRVTRATMHMWQTNATTWKFDFSDVLVFRDIKVARHDIVAESGFPQSVIRSVQGAVVVVETDVPVSATVTVSVDESTGNW